MKKIISTVLALLMVMSMIPMFALSISADEPDFKISNSDELLDFANNIGNYAGKTVEITADIAISSSTEWPDMSNKSFGGTLDGNGHTISGLRMTPSSDKSGFFGNVANSATVKDICITDSSITVTDKAKVGGVFGSVSGSCTIDNVYTNIAITVTRIDADIYEVGGFIGCINSNAQVNIKNSVSVGGVTTYGEIAKVGGLVGYIKQATMSITDSAVYGEVEANGNSTSVIVGRTEKANVTLTNVIAAGEMDIYGTSTQYGAFVGRIVSASVDRFKISSSVYTATQTVGSGNATNDSDYSSTTLEALKTTVPTGFNTWTTLNSEYPLPINVAYMVGHVNKDTATDRYETAFAGYQSTDFVDGFSNIRLIGVVNDMNGDVSLDDEYTAVGFEVEMISPKTWNNKVEGAAPQITTVYTSVLDGDTPISASELGGDYIFVATVTGIKQNVGDVTFVVKTFHDTDDGRVYDDAYVITYFTGAVASES